MGTQTTLCTFAISFSKKKKTGQNERCTTKRTKTDVRVIEEYNQHHLNKSSFEVFLNELFKLRDGVY